MAPVGFEAITRHKLRQAPVLSYDNPKRKLRKKWLKGRRLSFPRILDIRRDGKGFEPFLPEMQSGAVFKAHNNKEGNTPRGATNRSTSLRLFNVMQS